MRCKSLLFPPFLLSVVLNPTNHVILTFAHGTYVGTVSPNIIQNKMSPWFDNFGQDVTCNGQLPENHRRQGVNARGIWGYHAKNVGARYLVSRLSQGV